MTKTYPASYYANLDNQTEEEKALARKRKKVNDARKAREEALKSCGLVKVRGALGGVYWE